MKTFKRALAIFLTVLMVVLSFPMATLSFAAKEDAGSEDSIEAVLPEIPEGYSFKGMTNVDENGNTIYYIESDSGEVTIGKWIDADANEVADPDKPLAYENNNASKPDPMGDTLPESYDARDYGLVTPVEYQVGGTCWAHAAVSCIEANYIKQGFGDSLDLSEYHTVWFGKNGYVPGNNDSANDGYAIKNENDVLDKGGNTRDVGNAVLNFAGGVNEGDYPLVSTDKSSMLSEMKETFAYDNKYIHNTVVESIKSVPYDISKIKQAVYDYGAVWTMYYSGGKYYNFNNCWHVGDTQPVCFFDPNPDDIDHAVTIIGWDDNFSRENFGENKPVSDGAWLIKNSWSERWGNNGLFWISYEDKTISRYNSEVFSVGDASDYQDVYMYDGLGYRSTKSVKGGANVFVANADEYLTKISYGSVASRNYTLKIYKNLPDNYKKPTEGKLAYTKSGNTNGEKYISIDGKVKIAKGEIFSVVLETSYIYVEGSNYEADEEIYTYTSNPGESFYLDSLGKWNDTHEKGLNNVCIRAIAKGQETLPSYKVTFKDGTYSEIINSVDNTVQLPSKTGHTYVFTYDGKPFDPTTVEGDMTVTMHCYATDGVVNENSECITEFNCIYCGKQMLKPVVLHEYQWVTDTEPTCTSEGVKTYTCSSCGYSYTEKIPKVSHSDKDGDGYCDDCNAVIETDPSANCSCNCHKSGFSGFIWKITRLFYKLFKTHKYCDCGIAHY